MTNHDYLPPLLLTNLLTDLTDTKFSYLGTDSSLFMYLFMHSEQVLDKYHRQFIYSSAILDSVLLFRLCVDFIETRPIYFNNVNIINEDLISAQCKNVNIKVYNNNALYDNNYLNILHNPQESYIFDNLVSVNTIQYNNINFKLMSLEDTVCSLFFNYYNHKTLNSLLDAITLCVIYKDQIIFNKLIIRCLQIFNNTTKPFIYCLIGTQRLSFDYLCELNYSLEYIESVIDEIKQIL